MRQALRFQLPYADREAFVRAYAINISAAGMFIADHSPPAVGTAVRFEVVLSGEQPILRGEGEVVWASATHGLLCGFGVRFTALDDAGRELIAQVLAYKAKNPAQFVSEVPSPAVSYARPAAPPPSATSVPPPASAVSVPPRPSRDEEADLKSLLRPGSQPSKPTAANAAQLLDQLLGRRPG